MKPCVSIFDALCLDVYDELSDMPVVFFSPAFLQSPNPGWCVEGNPQPRPGGEYVLATLYGRQLDDVLDAYRKVEGVQIVNTEAAAECCDLPWPAQGTRVKRDEPQMVWVLTGHRDFRTGYYEGRWPD